MGEGTGLDWIMGEKWIRIKKGSECIGERGAEIKAREGRGV